MTVAELDGHGDTEVAAMLSGLGIALLDVQQPTQLVARRLVTIAARYTSDPIRVVALPTALVIQVGAVGYEVEVASRAMLRLDLAARIDDIADLAEAGAITPADAISAVALARAMPRRFGWVPTIVGYAVTTVGFGMVINATWAALPAHFFLGLVVGGVVLLGRRLPSLNPVVPTLSAMVVTVVATLLLADAANEGLLRVISPALIAVLPGMALTIGAMELASSEIVAGASRLVYGVAQLGLLVFGVALGVAIAGPAAPQSPSPQLGSWSLYVAIIVIGVGLYFYLSAPKGSLVWLISGVGVALVGQRVGGLFLAPAFSAAVGAFLIVPFAMMTARLRTAPPAIVMILVAFLSLVPGALSFVSVSGAVAGGQVDFLDLGVTLAAISSIALGTVVGASVFETVSSRALRQHDVI